MLSELASWSRLVPVLVGGGVGVHILNLAKCVGESSQSCTLRHKELLEQPTQTVWNRSAHADTERARCLPGVVNETLSSDAFDRVGWRRGRAQCGCSPMLIGSRQCSRHEGRGSQLGAHRDTHQHMHYITNTHTHKYIKNYWWFAHIHTNACAHRQASTHKHTHTHTHTPKQKQCCLALENKPMQLL